MTNDEGQGDVRISAVAAGDDHSLAAGWDLETAR